MKPSLKVLQMLSTASSVVEMGGGRFTVKWGNNQETVIYVYDARPTPRALDGAKAPRKSKRSTGSPRK